MSKGIKTGDYCSGCPQQNSCKEVYERLGRTTGPSVVGKVFTAFLLPIGMFIALLVGFDRLLATLKDDAFRTLAVFGLSLATTAATLWLLRLLRRKR